MRGDEDGATADFQNDVRHIGMLHLVLLRGDIAKNRH